MGTAGRVAILTPTAHQTRSRSRASPRCKGQIVCRCGLEHAWCVHECRVTQHSVQRGLNYIGHLRDVAESRNTSAAYAPVYGIFEGGHNCTAFFRSPIFTEWVFDEPSVRSR